MSESQAKAPYRASTWGLLIAVAAMAPSIAWNWLDGHIWPWDQAWYGEVSVDLYRKLVLDPGGWFAAMREAMPAKPPLLPWVGQFFVPIGLIVGNIDFGLMVANLITQTATLVVVWAIGRRLAPSRPLVALCGSLLVAGAPLFVGMSDQFFVEPLQTFIVAASFLLAITTSTTANWRSLILLVLLVVAGAAVKASTPAYCGFAWALAGWRLATNLRVRGRWPALAKGDVVLGLFTLAFTVATLVWYAHNLTTMFGHVVDSTSNEIAEQYGHSAEFFFKLLYWLEAQAAAFALSPIAFFIIALPALAFVCGEATQSVFSYVIDDAAANPDPSRVSRRLLALTASLHIVAVTCILALQPNEETRFLVPLLPSWAIVAMWTLSRIEFRGWTYAASLLCLAFLTQLVLVQSDALDLWRQRHVSTPWLLTYKAGTDERIRADALAQDSCPYATHQRYVIVGPDEPTVNANTLAYHSAKIALATGFRCFYTSLGYAEKDVDKALARIDAINPSFVILPEPQNISTNPDFLNLALKGVEERVRADNRYVALPQARSGYRVYERRE